MTSNERNQNSNNSKNSAASISQIVSEVIRRRRTAKVLAKPGKTIDHPHDDLKRLDQVVANAIVDAGFAPFHYDRNMDGIAEPWRFYVLKQAECRYLSENLTSWFANVKQNNKLPAMLSACGCLILVFWLPQFPELNEDCKQSQIDDEHLAATAAATQNLLISLTASNLKTYWSSGGFFRTDNMKTRLGIATHEKLLSAIFVDYGAATDSVETISGKQHALRSEYHHWTRELSRENFVDEPRMQNNG